jgi:hypothetical protein
MIAWQAAFFIFGRSERPDLRMIACRASVGKLVISVADHDKLPANAYSIQIPTDSARRSICARTLLFLANFSSPFLLDIFVIWIDRRVPTAIPTSLDYGVRQSRVHIHFFGSPRLPSLNDRFLIPSIIRTRIVLSWDDDILMAPSNVDKIFTFYVQNHLETHVVGIFARGCKGPVYQFTHRNYSLVLTGFAFLSIELLELYHHPAYQTARDEVSRLFSGEDMLINFIATSVYHTRPLAMPMQLHFHSMTGISTLSDHWRKRHYLCRTFQTLFDRTSVAHSTDGR